MLPNFIIIGAQRCGTTSLYNHLIKHPNIKPAIIKETHYFDSNLNRSLNWYKSFFPTKAFKYLNKFFKRRNIITGEATPYYIFLPHAAKIICSYIPNVKIIVLLRNPVNRAYSHYNYTVKLGFETLSFEEAIKKEQERLDGELEKLNKNPNYYSFSHQHWSYLERGKYVDQLKLWFSYFPKKQILIIRSEDFYKDPKNVMERVYNFLNLPKISSEKENIIYKKFNVGIYQKMDNKTSSYLKNFFKPYNKELSEFLNKNFNWEEELNS
jgi:hypothetical protein